MNLRGLVALLTLGSPPAPLAPVLAFRAVPQLGQGLLRLEAEAFEMEPLERALFFGGKECQQSILTGGMGRRVE